MLKSAHFTSIYGEKIIFFVARKCADLKKSFDAKMTARQNFLPLISVFTLVNSELRNFSSDKVILKLLIINDLRCHLSLVTFAFTSSFDVLCLFFVHGFIEFMKKNDIVNN